ncbi:MAG TPA: MHYT domain-containing protein [Hyphomicrobiales bacterium]
MQFSYDIGVAMLSVAIAILTVFTGLVMTTRLRDVRRRDAAIRIGLAGLALGGGFCATDAIAITAITAPVELHYDPLIAGLATLIAVLFAITALAGVGFDLLGRYTLPSATLFLGSGLAGTHHLGLAALQGDWQIGLGWLGAAGAGLIAIETAGLALWLAFRKRGVLDTVLASVAVALAAASTHYLGMEAVRFLPSAGTVLAVQNSAPNWPVALMTAAVMYCLCTVSLLVFCALTFKPRLVVKAARPLRLQAQG